jgi:uncharacterized protein YeaO (DUF488 family)
MLGLPTVNGEAANLLKEALIMIYTARIGERVQGKVIDITVRNNKDNVFAPTWGLVMDLKNKTITWEQYESKYKELIRFRMQTRTEEFKEIAETAKNEDVYLVCFCRDERFCHRRLAKEIIEGLIAKGVLKPFIFCLYRNQRLSY